MNKQKFFKYLLLYNINIYLILYQSKINYNYCKNDIKNILHFSLHKINIKG